MSPEIHLKRLQYRSMHRGCKETDLVLGHFAETGISQLDAAQLSLYERLLDEDDADIWDWLTGKTTPSAPEYVPLLEKLKCFVPSA